MASLRLFVVGLLAASPACIATSPCHRTKEQTSYALPVAVWAAAGGDVYVGGEQFRAHARWPDDIGIGDAAHSLDFVVEATPNKLYQSVWGSGSNDIYAAGFGFIEHSTGNEDWTTQLQSADITNVWGLDSAHIYACGHGGLLLSATGDGQWSREAIPTNATLGGIWGTDPGNLYVVGDGVILHRGADGGWTIERAGSEKWLSVWGSPVDGIYVSGLDSSGVIGHSSGDGTWDVIAIAGTTTLPWISGEPGKQVFAVGEPCAFLQKTPTEAWMRMGAGCGGGYLRGSQLGDYLYIVGDRFVWLMRAATQLEHFEVTYATTASFEESAPSSIDGTCLW